MENLCHCVIEVKYLSKDWLIDLKKNVPMDTTVFEKGIDTGVYSTSISVHDKLSKDEYAPVSNHASQDVKIPAGSIVAYVLCQPYSL